MNSGCKQVLAVFLNFAVLTHQLSAELQQITFDSMEWIPCQTVGQDPESGWQLVSGNAFVSPEGEGFGNTGKALKIPGTNQNETRLTRLIEWDPAEQTAFIDQQIRPSADPSGSLGTLFVNGTQIAFQVPEGSNTGEIWVYHGNDAATDPATQPEQWIKTVGSFVVPDGATTSSDYLRITLRHDYQRNLWDLFIDGKLAAANLGFEGRSGSLQTIEFFGGLAGDTLIDDISALSSNMLFPDSDKDGLSDEWEIANGSNPNVYDRDEIKPGGNSSFLDLYMDSLWGSGSINGNSPVASSGGIPPLSILGSHKPVGSLKGSLSVGADGSANYSIPIDLPKGTAGMEPKLSLAYSSNGGNGLLGVGWNLNGLQQVTRGPATAAKDEAYDPLDFDDNDRFFLDGERLVCVTGTYGAPDSEYRTEMDSYARITAIGSGPASWKVETKSGLIVYLGGTADSKVAIQSGTLSWGVNRVEDTVGNFYSVEYTRDQATADFDFVNHRVSAIRYTGNTAKSLAPDCSVVFDYETRPDISRSYTTHAGYRADKRLAKIRVLTGSYVNHSYHISKLM